MRDSSLMERIDLYCAGRLDKAEIETLWTDLLNYPEYFEHLETAANLAGIKLPPIQPNQNATL